MFLAGNAVFLSFGVGTILVVAVAVLGSRHRAARDALLARRQGLDREGPRAVPRRPAPPQPRRVARVGRDPRPRAQAPRRLGDRRRAGCCVALALPALGMHTINPGVAGLPRSLPIMQTYDRIQAAFPGGPLPAVVVVQADDVTRARGAGRDRGAARGARRQSKDFGQPVTTHDQPAPRRSRSSASRWPATAPTTRSEAALATLRDDVIPQTLGARAAASQVDVTGMTAGSKDFNDTMKSHLPIVFAFVLGLAFLLLLVTFRSIVIPIKAIVLNLLSVGAAYGDPHARLPGRARREPARLPLDRRHHVVAAAVPVRDPVRPVDGLPRVHPQPDPRGGRRRHEHRPRGRARHQADRRRGHERGGRDGRGVRDLRHAELARVQADGRRPGGRRPDRRDASCGRCCCPRR